MIYVIKVINPVVKFKADEKMILQTIEYAIAIVFAVIGVVFVGASLYFGYKYKDKLRNMKENAKCLLLATVSFSTSIFFLLTAMNGFSLNSLFVALFFLVLLSLRSILPYMIHSGTTEFLNKRNITPESPMEVLKKLREQNFSNDKENK